MSKHMSLAIKMGKQAENLRHRSMERINPREDP